MCKKREEKHLVAALVEMSDNDRPMIRHLLADAGRIIRRTYRKKYFPVPQHLVENMCVTFTDHFGQIETPEELAVKTIRFFRKGMSAPFNIN